MAPRLVIETIAGLIDAIGEPMSPPEPKRRPIGFITPEEKKRR